MCGGPDNIYVNLRVFICAMRAGGKSFRKRPLARACAIRHPWHLLSKTKPHTHWMVASLAYCNQRASYGGSVE